jgi:hypothetical protein
MPRPLLILIMMCTAVAAWLSQGTIGATGTGAGRVALLPVSIPAFAICLGAAAGVLAAWRVGASLAPLWMLVFVVLPWLPRSLPTAFLIWSGPGVLLVWLAVALAILSTTWSAHAWTTSRLANVIASRPRLTAALLACLVYGVGAWQDSPTVRGGDEPHYLIITQSLLEDGDLKIENNHRAGDYHAYFEGDLSKPDYRRLGRNGQIYSIHGPGLPLLIAPAFAVAGYHGVVVFLVLVAAAGGALAWHLAWLVTGRADAAWFGWAAVALSTSVIFHSFTVYPDGVGGVIVLTGIWALLRAEEEARSGSERAWAWAAHGAAIALLPWIHTRFALLAGSLGALVLLRLGTNRNAAGKAVAFLSIPALSAICWIGFFIDIYGTPDPSFPYGNEEGAASFIPGGVVGLLFDQRFGLLAYAPVLAFAFAGVIAMVRRSSQRRAGLELLFVLVPYLIVVTHFAMWWGGTSAPARFFVPVLPMLAIPSAVAWTATRHRATRATALAALAFTIFVSGCLIFVDGGRLAYNTREGYAGWAEWLNRATDLRRALPAWWRGSENILFRDVTVWIITTGVAWVALRAAEGMRWTRTRGGLAAATGAVYAVAAMCAASAVWALAGVRGRADTPGQLELLRRVGAEDTNVLVGLPAFNRLTPEDLVQTLRISPPPSITPGGAGPNDRPLYQVPAVPAGRYRVVLHGAATSGWLMVGIGRDQFSIVSGPLASPAAPIDLDFPVDVRAIVVRGDEQARRSITGLTIEPLSILVPGDRIAPGSAVRAVRYDATTTYFMDDRSFPEPDAFWVGGRRTSSLVLHPDTPGASLSLLLRNGPQANRVTLRAGTWAADLSLGPSEERHMVVPADRARSATLLTIGSAQGFRPSDADRNSRDTRLLGVWVKLAAPAP